MKWVTSLVVAVVGAVGLAIGTGLAAFEVHVHVERSQEATVQEGTAMCASTFTKGAGGWVSDVRILPDADILRVPGSC